MSLEPPKLDQRSYEDIVQHSVKLAESYTDWRSPESKSPPSVDVGLALVRIFGHMMTVVQDRLNQVPSRNQLAFMNLIGTELIPPQPSRVPVTFNLAAGSPVEALVPKQTRIAAPPQEGDDEEIVFETERELLVTDTQLNAIFVIEDRDYYSDRHSAAVVDAVHEPFHVFHGDTTVEHYLYLHGKDLFDLPKLETITVTFETDSPESAEQLAFRLRDWMMWDGKFWQPLTAVECESARSQVQVTLSQLPKLKEVEVNGLAAKWLRVSLDPHNRQNLPELVSSLITTHIDRPALPEECFFNTIRLDLSKDFYPFGTTPQYNDTFLMALDPHLIQPSMAIEIQAQLSQVPRYTDDLELLWEVGCGQQWQTIESTEDVEKFRWQSDSAPLRLVEESVTGIFQFPATLPPLPLGEKNYWLRARIVQGLYGSRGRTRQYVMYNDVTMLSTAIAIGQTEIVVDNIEALAVEDTIRIQSGLDPTRQEEAKIVAVRPATSVVVLNRATRNAYTAGSRILSKFAITDQTSDIFAPPILQSITLTYRFFLERKATIKSYNDFIFADSDALELFLHRSICAGERIVELNDVSALAVGEIIKFTGQTVELGQIELIDRDRQRVILVKPLDYDHLNATRVWRSFHPLTPQIHRDSSLYLGFNRPFPNRANTLYLQIQAPQPEDVAPGVNQMAHLSHAQRLVWEYPSPKGWLPLTVVDETQGFLEKGLIQFVGPTDWITSPHFGQQCYWLRVRQQPLDWQSLPMVLFYLWKWAITFELYNLYSMMRYFARLVARSVDLPVPPRLCAVRTNTTWANQSITLNGEVLGSSNHEPNQVLKASQFPILWGESLAIEEGRLPSESDQQYLRQHFGDEAIAAHYDETGRLETVWVRWQEVPDFHSSMPHDRHYVIDRQLGQIRFGDGQAGKIPPRGRNNIRLNTYCTGGGIRGNQAAQSITELKTTIPYIAQAINWESAQGGNNQESLERLKERSPKHLRHGDRAVTAQDFADLTYEASIDIARVQVITPDMMAPDFSPLLEELWIDPHPDPNHQAIAGNEIDVFKNELRAGWVQVIVVPHSPDHQPTPNLALLNRVTQFLKARYVPTLQLRVSGPKWQEIRVNTEIVPQSVANAGTVKADVLKALQQFFHPLTGGQQGSGWQFGRRPHHSDVYAVLEAVPGVRYVHALDIQPANVIIDQQTLIYSGTHQIELKLPEIST
ncbi:putative baseplate assembly protein [Pseudanabaena sp. UWO310]|uniref:putative baseplate assembly protein n=1 Tax=Pseudanabaena sp. UWO310 TaxID=2480795 RepID=UPI001157BFB1|nr:putative baseplate assembly protein [Pseudanabaena sp. UWO310]TYQ30987.1 putative baseplate assembly protein [Pseudanabaena sp. UWO310]